MNDKDDELFSAELSRELKNQPELQAPDTLIPRVMAVIRYGATARVPWYRRPWPLWPVPLQTASLLVLLAFFAGLCHLGWRFYHGESLTTAMGEIGEWISSWRVFGSVISSLITALTLIINKLGTGFMIAFLTMAAFSYATCIGLGTMFVRFAFPRRTNSL